jgi:hypothetical protein
LIFFFCLATAILSLPALAQGEFNAERVTVRYSEGAWELGSINELNSVMLPMDELPNASAVSGYWYELRDSSGAVRYRRVIGDPVRLFFEGPKVLQEEARMAPAAMNLRSAPMEERGRTARHLNTPAREDRNSASRSAAQVGRFRTMGVPERTEAIPELRTFTVLIPTSQTGDVLAIVGSPLDLGTQAQPANVQATFELKPEKGGEGEGQ